MKLTAWHTIIVSSFRKWELEYSSKIGGLEDEETSFHSWPNRKEGWKRNERSLSSFSLQSFLLTSIPTTLEMNNDTSASVLVLSRFLLSSIICPKRILEHHQKSLHLDYKIPHLVHNKWIVVKTVFATNMSISMWTEFWATQNSVNDLKSPFIVPFAFLFLLCLACRSSSCVLSNDMTYPDQKFPVINTTHMKSSQHQWDRVLGE